MTPVPADLPRVLLLTSSAFNSLSGGGITLGNLFRGWPRERLAVAHNDPIPPDPEPCARYYALGQDELGWQWPLSLWQRRAPSGVVTADGAASPRAATGAPRRWARGLLRAVTSDGGLHDHAAVTPALRAWIAELRPQVLYTFLGSLGFVRLARAIADETGAAIVVHMMDDWPRTLYRGGLLGPYLRATLDRELRGLLARAATRMGIGADMCEEYRRRYGLEFLPFHNVLDATAWRPHMRRDWAVRSPARLLYAGSILANAQRDSLLDIARAVGELRTEGLEVELHLHTPFGRADANRPFFEGLPGVFLGDPPPGEAIAQELAAADVLVLPVNFDGATIEYVRLSFPTKLPAYMLSGTPILAYGPEEVAQIRLARDEGWGRVVSRRDRPLLKAAIRALCQPGDGRAQLGRRAQDVAQRDHDASRVRAGFQQAIASAPKVR